MNKIMKFLKMNKYERRLSLCRNLYSKINKNQFGEIGAKSYFLDPIYLAGTKYMKIGRETGFWHHARVEVIAQWNEDVFTPNLKIGNYVMVGQDCHITCADSIVIEDNVLISSGVFITDLSHETSNLEMPVIKQGLTTKPVKICEGAFIGKDVMIMPGVTLGRHCVVGANAVVTKDVPDFATVAGVPAKPVGKR